MNCPYLIQVDVIPYRGNVFDHPDYKFYCTIKKKKKEILSYRCSHCEYNTANRKEEKR